MVDTFAVSGFPDDLDKIFVVPIDGSATVGFDG